MNILVINFNALNYSVTNQFNSGSLFSLSIMSFRSNGAREGANFLKMVFWNNAVFLVVGFLFLAA